MLYLLAWMPSESIGSAAGDATLAAPPETADFWLARLRTEAQTRRQDERLTITVDHRTRRGAESLVFRSQPVAGFAEPEISLDLGKIRVWTRPAGLTEDRDPAIRIAHELDFRSYYEAPTTPGATTTEALREAIPALMVPHLALTLGGPLFPDFGPVVWTEALEDRPRVGTPTVRLSGATESGEEIELTIEADDSPRLTSAIVRVPDERVTIRIACEPAQSEPGRLGYDIAGRERLERMSDLRARPGDIRAGDTLPYMPLVFFTLDDTVPVEAYRHKLMIFFDAHDLATGLPEDVAIGLDALREASRRIGPVTRIEPIGIFNPLDVAGQIQIVEVNLMEATDPDRPWYSLSDTYSIRRVSADGSPVIVVASKGGYVAGVIELEPVDGELSEEEREGRVSRLASRVVELCRALDRRSDGRD